MNKYEIVTMANNKEVDYYDSVYLPYPYVFYTESDSESTYIEICDEINWDRIVHIEKPIDEKFTDEDVAELIEEVKSVPKVKVDLTLGYLKDNSWGGAKDTLYTVLGHGLGDELMDLIKVIFEKDVTDTQINDFLWFDDEFIFESLGIEEE